MNARIVAVYLFLCLSTGFTLKNDDVDDDILDMLQETDKLKEAPEMKEDDLVDRSCTVNSDTSTYAAIYDSFTTAIANFTSTPSEVFPTTVITTDTFPLSEASSIASESSASSYLLSSTASVY